MSDLLRDGAYRCDMLSRSKLAVEEMRGKSVSDLTPDSRTAAAVERWIEIVGGAARRVSGDFKLAHPEIQWAKIIATRHIPAHEYDDIDDDVIWRIVTQHLPALIRDLEPLVRGWSQDARDGLPASADATDPSS